MKNFYGAISSGTIPSDLGEPDAWSAAVLREAVACTPARSARFWVAVGLPGRDPVLFPASKGRVWQLLAQMTGIARAWRRGRDVVVLAEARA